MMNNKLFLFFIVLVGSSTAVAQDLPKNSTVYDPNTSIYSTTGNTPAKGKTVGTCNSTKGCNRLQAACKNGYEYTSTKSGGICKSKSTMAAKLNLTSIPRVSEDAKCFNTAFCQKLKAHCHGGKWKKGAGRSGTCKD